MMTLLLFTKLFQHIFIMCLLITMSIFYVYIRSLQQAVRIYSVAFYDISVILRSAAALFRQ